MSTTARYHLPDPPTSYSDEEVSTWDGTGICPSAIANKDEFEARTGMKCHPKAFDFHPQGCRITVFREPVPEEYGSIALPQEYLRTESMGIGWIVAAGPLSHREVPIPFGPMIERPEDLLYRKILMSQTIGQCIRLDVTERDFRSNLIVMTTRDIWCFDEKPTTPIGQLEE
jgi:hypothetical protein